MAFSATFSLDQMSGSFSSPLPSATSSIDIPLPSLSLLRPQHLLRSQGRSLLPHCQPLPRQPSSYPALPVPFSPPARHLSVPPLVLHHHHRYLWSLQLFDFFSYRFGWNNYCVFVPFSSASVSATLSTSSSSATTIPTTLIIPPSSSTGRLTTSVLTSTSTASGSEGTSATSANGAANSRTLASSVISLSVSVIALSLLNL
ncbi:hypothetical protein BDQ17DRAFT_797780 [Cyathus striatus]|nr:hypothetical protein BDQ17DRAFT_797780 [Cyathus striatus]